MWLVFKYTVIIILEFIDGWLFVFSEYYFSLPNLERDFFLRRKMDSKGFLPISLIASFHRVQALTTDVNLIKEVTIDPSPLLFQSLLSLCCYICFCVYEQALKNSEVVELVDEQIRRKVEPEHWPISTPALDFSQLIHCPEFIPGQTFTSLSTGSDVFHCLAIFLLYLGLFCSVVLQLYCYFAWFWKWQPWLYSWHSLTCLRSLPLHVPQCRPPQSVST